MTLLGKIFTALIFITSIVCLTLAVIVGGTHQNWVQAANDARDKVSDLQQAVDAAKQEREDLENKIQRERVARAMVIQQLEVKKELNRRRLEEKEAELQAQTQISQEALSQLNTAEDRLKELDDQNENLKTENIALRTGLHDNITEVVTLTDQNHQLEAKLINQEERFAQITDELARASRVLTSNGLTTESLTDHIVPEVEGFITGVSQKFPGVIEINIGAQDGLRKGHEMEVVRDGEYLGRVKITQTSPNQAIGQLIDDLTRGPIKEGDRVTSKF